MAARKGRKRKPSWDASGLPEGILPPEAQRPVNWRDRSAALVAVYNDCLVRVVAKTHAPLRVKSPSKNNCEFFFGLHLWCEQQGFDTVGWIYAAFASLSFKRPVGVRDLLNANRRSVYDAMDNNDWRTVSGVQDTLRSNELRSFKPLEDLHPSGAEVAKRNYLARGDYKLCMASIDITLGFHPASEVCHQCPARQECKARTERLRAEVQARSRLV